MNVSDSFYDVQKIDHLPDSRGEIAHEKTAPEIPAQPVDIDPQILMGALGASIIINVLLLLTVVYLLWIE